MKEKKNAEKNVSCQSHEQKKKSRWRPRDSLGIFVMSHRRMTRFFIDEIDFGCLFFSLSFSSNSIVFGIFVSIAFRMMGAINAYIHTQAHIRTHTFISSSTYPRIIIPPGISKYFIFILFYSDVVVFSRFECYLVKSRLRWWWRGQSWMCTFPFVSNSAFN